MKILVVGATGTIGKAVVESLSGQHEVIPAGYSSGDVQVDIANADSVSAMFDSVGSVDAVISTAGNAAFAPLAELTDENYQLGLNNKLMGQVNLLRLGRDHINEKGSITLTSGILSRHPIPGSASIAMVNGALESYVRAAALELDAVRVNVVAPAWVKETMEMMGMDSTPGISAADTAKAYVAAVEGQVHGQTLDASDYV